MASLFSGSIGNQAQRDTIGFWDVFYNTPSRMRFRLDTRVIWEAGCLNYLPKIIPEYGERVAVVMDQGLASLALAKSVIEVLQKHLPVTVVYPDAGEPGEKNLYPKSIELISRWLHRSLTLIKRYVVYRSRNNMVKVGW